MPGRARPPKRDGAGDFPASANASACADATLAALMLSPVGAFACGDAEKSARAVVTSSRSRVSVCGSEECVIEGGRGGGGGGEE